MVHRPEPAPDAASVRSIPVRTCVGCRVRAEKTELVRFVLEQGLVVPDPLGRMPGRGASLHPAPECLELAERRRAFGRSLHSQGQVDLSAARRYLEAQQY